jgi:hypothetical protein
MLPPLGIYIEGEARQATYRLNCFREFTQARFGHSEVLEKMNDEWPSLLAPGGKYFQRTSISVDQCFSPDFCGRSWKTTILLSFPTHEVCFRRQ